MRQVGGPAVVAARLGLVVAAVAILAAWGFGALEHFQVGLPGERPRAQEAGDRVRDAFSAATASYRRWGRWIDLSTAVAFAALLLVVSRLRRGAQQARGLLMTGLAIAVAADAVDLSKLGALDIARFADVHHLDADFAAAKVAWYMLDGTSTHVWGAGLLLVAAGLVLVAGEAGDGRWRTVTIVFALSVVATSVTALVAPLERMFVPAFSAMVASLIAWATSARHHLGPSERMVGHS